MERLIGDIYEAASAPDLWIGVLDKLARRFGTRGALVFRVSAEGVSWIGAGEITEHLPDFIAAGQMQGNPRLKEALKLQRPGFVTDLDLYPIDEIGRLPMYRDYLIPRGFDAGAATIVRGAGSDTLFLSLEGFPGHVQARAAVPELNKLRPHLARAALLASQLQFERVRGAVEGLSMIGVAAAMLDGRGRILAANAPFSGAIGELVLDQPSRLRMVDRHADQKLSEALEIARGRQPVGRSIPLPRRDGRVPAVAHLMPILGRGRDPFAGAAAVLVLTDATHRQPLGLDLLHSLFDLTPAESRVARALAEGKTPSEIGLQLGVTLLTIRTQIRSILGKTGQRRAVDLVRLLTSLSDHAPPEGVAPAPAR